ncbi:hypothetical protein FKM82_015320 [Ascaphus truei]
MGHHIWRLWRKPTRAWQGLLVTGSLWRYLRGVRIRDRWFLPRQL